MGSPADSRWEMWVCRVPCRGMARTPTRRTSRRQVSDTVAGNMGDPSASVKTVSLGPIAPPSRARNARHRSSASTVPESREMVRREDRFFGAP